MTEPNEKHFSSSAKHTFSRAACAAASSTFSASPALIISASDGITACSSKIERQSFVLMPGKHDSPPTSKRRAWPAAESAGSWPETRILSCSL